MNLKIVSSSLIGIFVAIMIFYLIINWYPSNFDSSYIWVEHMKNKSEKPLILLIGSSHTGVLDTDTIQKHLTDNKLEYKVYNLARSSDHPTRWADTVSYITELNPKIIFFGIEPRLFEGQPSVKQEELTALQITNIDSVTPNTKEIFDKIINPLLNNDFFTHIPSSPKIITLQTIKYFVRDANQTTVLDNDSNRPFFNVGKKIEPLVDLEIIQKDWEKRNRQFNGIDPSTNREFKALKDQIEELKNKDIQVVVFATPKSSVYINWLGVEDKKIFDQMLKELENSDTPVYSVFEKYADYNIWSDAIHVIQNRTGIIYSEDIAKIIIKEIEK